MEKNMGDVVLYVDDLKPSSAIVVSCRICHEEELESCKTMEAPCACSGTVMFAHRDCIQRWCNEKGNTTCEICLQKFEPGYTAPPNKSHLIIDATILTIRGSLEVPRREGEHQNRGLEGMAETDSLMIETNYYYTEQSSAPTDWSTTCCRSMALVFTVLLLGRPLFAVFTGGTEHYPSTLATLNILRASGILLPMYMLVRVVAAIQIIIRR